SSIKFKLLWQKTIVTNNSRVVTRAMSTKDKVGKANRADRASSALRLRARSTMSSKVVPVSLGLLQSRDVADRASKVVAWVMKVETKVAARTSVLLVRWMKMRI